MGVLFLWELVKFQDNQSAEDVSHVPICDNLSPAQIRLSEVSGVEVADRRGYLTLELETGKEGVLLLRYRVNYSLLHWPT